MAATQLEEFPVRDVRELSAEALREGPHVVSGLAEDDQLSVLWFENDLFLRRDFSDPQHAFGLARAIDVARGTQDEGGGEFALALD